MHIVQGSVSRNLRPEGKFLDLNAPVRLHLRSQL
jgi:hypothetical protein